MLKSPHRSKHRVLLLLPTTTYRAHDFIEAGTSLGITTIVASNQKQALEDLVPDQTVAMDFNDPRKAAGRIVELARRRPLKAIIPTDEETAEIAALAAAELGLTHNPPAAAAAARYKNVLREKLLAEGVPTPAFRLLERGANPGPLALEQSYPCVLKPTFLAASRGVIRANDPEEFVASFHRIEALLSLPDIEARGGPAARHIMVEEFIPGIEVALEGILRGKQLRVLALFDKPDPLDGPFFQETLYVTPSRHPPERQAAIVKTTQDAAAALGLIEGPVHAELRLNEKGPWLIEIAARSIGGLCSRVLKFGTGISLEELILMHAVGETIDALDRDPTPAGVMMIPPPGSGILKRVDGIESARKTPGIVDVTISIPLGKPVVPLPEGSSYLGFIFARQRTPDLVEAALRAAHERLSFQLEEVASGFGPIP